jgi:hypothetical protein
MPTMLIAPMTGTIAVVVRSRLVIIMIIIVEVFVRIVVRSDVIEKPLVETVVHDVQHLEAVSECDGARSDLLGPAVHHVPEGPIDHFDDAQGDHELAQHRAQVDCLGLGG